MTIVATTDNVATTESVRVDEDLPRWVSAEMRPIVAGWVPAALLVAGFLISALGRTVTTLGQAVVIGVLSIVGIAVHLLWTRAQWLGMASRIGVYALEIAITAALIWFSPWYGIYGFTGYIAAFLLFDRPALSYALLCNAVVVSASQVGGFQQIPRVPGAYVGMVLVNAVILIVVFWLQVRRHREIEERERAVASLEAALARNAELQQELLDRAREQGVVTERARLSREIHDTVAQDLVAIVSQLEAIGDVDLHEDAVRERVGTAKQLARDGLGEARRAVEALRSPMLDRRELPNAIGDLLRGWGITHHVVVRLHVDGDPAPTGSDQQLLRICQEALSNVARHAEAGQVLVHLRYVDEGVLLDITDDGRGFDPERVPEGHGLRGMRERVEQSGGTVDVDTQPGSGSVIRVAVPV